MKGTAPSARNIMQDGKAWLVWRMTITSNDGHSEQPDGTQGTSIQLGPEIEQELQQERRSAFE